MRHLVKRSFALAGHRTSVALEAEFWTVLDRLARRGGASTAALVAAVDAGRITTGRPLASALRVHALRSVRADEFGGQNTFRSGGDS